MTCECCAGALRGDAKQRIGLNSCRQDAMPCRGFVSLDSINITCTVMLWLQTLSSPRHAGACYLDSAKDAVSAEEGGGGGVGSLDTNPVVARKLLKALARKGPHRADQAWPAWGSRSIESRRTSREGI